MIWHDRPPMEIVPALERMLAAFKLPEGEGYPRFSSRETFAGPERMESDLVVETADVSGPVTVVLHEILHKVSFDDAGMHHAAHDAISKIAGALRTLQPSAASYLGTPSQPWFLAGLVVARTYGEPTIVSLPSPWRPLRAECDTWSELHIPDDVRARFTQHAPKGISILTQPVHGEPNTITVCGLEAFVGNHSCSDIDIKANPSLTMQAIKMAVAAGALAPSVA